MGNHIRKQIGLNPDGGASQKKGELPGTMQDPANLNGVFFNNIKNKIFFDDQDAISQFSQSIIFRKNAEIGVT
jgi:hypothetical protein